MRGNVDTMCKMVVKYEHGAIASVYIDGAQLSSVKRVEIADIKPGSLPEVTLVISPEMFVIDRTYSKE